MDGILSIAPAYNRNFNRLLSYYGITPGSTYPLGKNNINFSYYACDNFKDQINLYRLYKSASGGLNSPYPIYGDLIDVTKTLKLPYKFFLEKEWAIPNFVEDDFESHIQNTVKFLKSNYSHCNILYSGGVDSTAMVAGFMKYADRNDYTICYTSESINEYPAFFELIKQQRIDLINLEEINMSSIDGLLLEGSVEAPIGCTIYAEKNILNNHWTDAISKEEWGIYYEDIIEMGSHLMSLYGKQNGDVSDLVIFIEGICKSSKNLHIHYEKDLKKEQFYSFYGSPWFMSWLYHHSAKYMVDSHLSEYYKTPHKKSILEVFPDPILKFKNKGYSRHLWTLKCNNGGGADSAIDYFFINYDNERISASCIEEYREKYGTRFDHYFTT